MTFKRWTVLAAIAIVLIVAATALWIRHELTTPYFGAGGGEVFVDVPKGAGGTTIARLLSDAGVIRFRFPFMLYERLGDLGRRMKAGEYRFASPATPIEVASRIAAGDVYYVSITIPEGLTARETVELLARNGIANLELLQRALGHTDWIKDLNPDARDLEGFLFPETYRFPHTIAADDVVRTLVNEFRARFSALQSRSPMSSGWNAEAIVTLASMIEKEVKAPEERPLVASVLINRLRANMPLGCDSTIIYALKTSGRFDGTLHKVNLSMESPYNSYIHKGLPPGPIASPGEASLAAALRPAETAYFYYVSRNDGTHQFSKDYSAHLLAVSRYQKPLAHRSKSNHTR
jgi:UPF0755 protein